MAGRKSVRRRERRRMTRADAQLSMRVEGGGADGTLLPIVTESRNISGSGVYCLSPHYLAPLSKVALTIVLPQLPGRGTGHQLLKCEGVVVRCQAGAGARRERGYQLACSFLGLDEGARARLHEFVAWRNLQALRGGGPAARERSRGRRRPPSTDGVPTGPRAVAKRGRAPARRSSPRGPRTVH